MKRYEIREVSMSGYCCFVATVFDSKTGNTYEFFDMESANEICDALNAREEHKEEISRLKAELKRWKDAREASLACEKIMLDELKSMRRELEALKRERDAYLKALKEVADEQFGTVDECIEFADRCIRQMGGDR